LDELLLTLQSFKNYKAPGPDDINTELIRNVLPYRFLKIVIFLNICWQSGFIPDEYKEAVAFPVLKKRQ
jgi:hypothetical protein